MSIIGSGNRQKEHTLTNDVKTITPIADVGCNNFDQNIVRHSFILLCILTTYIIKERSESQSHWPKFLIYQSKIQKKQERKFCVLWTSYSCLNEYFCTSNQNQA